MGLLTIDPGLNGCGAALWRDRELWWAAYVRNPNGVEPYSMVAAVVGSLPLPATSLAIELPQVYVRTRAKGDPNDLIALAVVVGCFIDRFGGPPFSYTTYKPFDWKGQVPKQIMEDRTKAKLSPEELAHVKLPTASLAHNVWDAIALGLHDLRR